MIKASLKCLSLVLIAVSFFQAHAADSTAPLTTPPPVLTAPTTSWNVLLQKKYNLTDVQMKALTDAKLAEPQMAMAAQIAKTSNKSIEEVLKMQSEKKMGWGALAKELGVAPKELGQAVSEMKRARNEERKKLKAEKNTDESKDENHDSNHEKKDHHEKKDGHEKKDRPPKKDK